VSSKANTLELQQRTSVLRSLLGFHRDRDRLTLLILPFAVSLNPVLAGIGPSGAFDHAQIAAAESKSKVPGQVNFLLVAKGHRSGVTEPLQIVVRSQAEWVALWRRHTNELNLTPPMVHFDREIVVGVFLGQKPTGGYDTAIVRAEKSADALVIYYEEKTPAPGSMVIQVLEQPYHIVRMNRDVGSMVTFRRVP
jgi:hypothetical protein